MLTKDELLTEVMDINFDLSKENNRLKEQIKELQTLLNKANAQLQEGNIPNVNSSETVKKNKIGDQV